MPNQLHVPRSCCRAAVPLTVHQEAAPSTAFAMDDTNETTGANALYELLEVTFAAGAWSLLDVCCMCASSKMMRSAWLQLLKQQPSPTWLIAAVADAAHARTYALLAKATNVMQWLLVTLPEARLAEHPSIPAGLLAIPCMPPTLAVELCRLGVWMPYADVAAAARRRVAGVEAWLVAQTKLGRQHDIPAVGAAILLDAGPLAWQAYMNRFCPPDAAWLVPQRHVYEVLALGLNSGDAAMASRTFNLLARISEGQVTPTPAALELPADEAVSLLHTAVERHIYQHHHHNWDTQSRLLHVLVRHVPSVQLLTPAQLLPVVQRAAELDAAFRRLSGPLAGSFSLFDTGEGTCVYELDWLPAVQQIPADAVAGLLRMAMTSGDSCSVCCVTSWAAFHQVEAEQLAGLLEVAVQVSVTQGLNVCSHYLNLLTKAPAIHQVDPAKLTAAMLVEARAANYCDAIAQLKQSRAAAHEMVLLPVVLAALQAWNTAAVYCLLDLDQAESEAAASISTEGIVTVLQAVLQHHPQMFGRLLELPVAASLTGDDLAVLLHFAVKWGRLTAVDEHLQKHTSWASISGENRVSGLLQLVVKQGLDCRSFCASPYAAAVDAAMVAQLLQEAVSASHHINLQALLQLPAAAQLTREQIVEVMTLQVAAACNQRHYADTPGPATGALLAATAFCRGAAGELSWKMHGLGLSSYSLVGAAQASCLSVLCLWSRTAGIGAPALLQLLQTAGGLAPGQVEGDLPAHAPNKAVLWQLCSSLAAASISSAEQLQPLLEVALSCKDAASVRALLLCPGAAGITPTMLCGLLQSVATQNCTGVKVTALVQWRQQHKDAQASSI